MNSVSTQRFMGKADEVLAALTVIRLGDEVSFDSDDLERQGRVVHSDHTNYWVRVDGVLFFVLHDHLRKL